MHRLVLMLTLTALVGAMPKGVTGQEVNPAHTHIRHVLEAFPSAPDGAGLLAIADAEAALALQHARLAMRDPSDIDGMKRHTRHVLNTIDPTEVDSGPGLGFGVRAAARGIVRHIQLAAASDAASQNVRTHAAHVVAAAESVDKSAGQIVELAGRILETSDYNRAFGMVEDLRELCEQLTTGNDAAGDGTVSLEEGGLSHVRRHVTLMAEGEGLI